MIIPIAFVVLVPFFVILLVGITVNIFHDRLEELAVKDDLTGLFNRRKFDELFNRENDLAKRFGYVKSLLFVDIDDFKSIDDKFGHPAGDRYLQKISGILRENIREIDVVVRWGGEDYLPCYTGLLTRSPLGGFLGTFRKAVKSHHGDSSFRYSSTPNYNKIRFALCDS